jgi:hypothetical protein
MRYELTSTTARALAPGSSPAHAFRASWSFVRAEVASARAVVWDEEGSMRRVENGMREVVGRAYRSGGMVSRVKDDGG